MKKFFLVLTAVVALTILSKIMIVGAEETVSNTEVMTNEIMNDTNSVTNETNNETTADSDSGESSTGGMTQ